MQLQIPRLQKEEVFRRRMYFKNWGLFRPFLFKDGVPRFFLYSLQFYVFYLILMLFSTLMMTKVFRFELRIVCHIILLVLIFVVGIMLTSRDPAICSCEYPIVNLKELIKMKNFCEKCRCFVNINTSNQVNVSQKNIRHCQRCDVCLQGILYHSEFFGRCVTKKTYIYVAFWWGLIIILTLFNAYVYKYI